MSLARAMIEAAVDGEEPRDLVDAVVALGEDFGDKEYKDFKRAAEGKRIRKRKPKTEAVDFAAEARKVGKVLLAVRSARATLKQALDGMSNKKSLPKVVLRAYKDLGASMDPLKSLADSLEGKA